MRRFYALVLGGIGANNVLPLRIGDLLRARWLAKAAAIPSGRAFGSVVPRPRLRRASRSSSRSPCRCRSSATPPGWTGSQSEESSSSRCSRSSIGGAVVYTRTQPAGPTGEPGRARRLLRDTIDEVASPIGRRRLVLALGSERRRLGRLGRFRRARLPVARLLALPDRARLRHGRDQSRRRDPELARVHRHLPVARRLGARRRRRRRRGRDRVLAAHAGDLVHPDDDRGRRDRRCERCTETRATMPVESEPPVPSPG